MNELLQVKLVLDVCLLVALIAYRKDYFRWVEAKRNERERRKRDRDFGRVVRLERVTDGRARGLTPAVLVDAIGDHVDGRRRRTAQQAKHHPQSTIGVTGGPLAEQRDVSSGQRCIDVDLPPLEADVEIGPVRGRRGLRRH